MALEAILLGHLLTCRERSISKHNTWCHRRPGWHCAWCGSAMNDMYASLARLLAQVSQCTKIYDTFVVINLKCHKISHPNNSDKIIGHHKSCHYEKNKSSLGWYMDVKHQKAYGKNEMENVLLPWVEPLTDQMGSLYYTWSRMSVSGELVAEVLRLKQ